MTLYLHRFDRPGRLMAAAIAVAGFGGRATDYAMLSVFPGRP
jgi:hypothetical protein